MKIIFWFQLILIAYVYFGYPLLILLISVFVHKRIIKADIEPTITFLITAYNEEKNIEEKLLNTLNLDYPREKLEIIVASDGSTDKTDEIVSNYRNKGVILYKIEGRVGKTGTQNEAIKIAHGEIIVFSDATTQYDKLALRKIVRNYADPCVGAVSGRYEYFDPKKTHIGSGQIAFWDYENFIKERQTQIGTITGCCGCIYSIRRQLYVPLPKDIISDLVEPLKILEEGYKIVFEPEAIAYETTCESSNQEFKMRIRVISRGIRGLLYMKALFNPFKYSFITLQLISHKVLRWLVPLFLIGLYTANVFLLREGYFYLFLFLLQTLFYLIAIFGLIMDRLNKKVRALSLPLYFCVVNAASILALLKTILKKKDITWETIRK